MKKKLLFIMFILIGFDSYAQTAIKISFETQTIIKEESLKSIPVHIRAAALQQLLSIKKQSIMIIQDRKVYFESKHSEQEVVNKGVINTKEAENGVLFTKDLSTSVSFSAIKLIKDPKTNTYVTRDKKELLSKKIPVVEWKITNKQKKILGYRCYEAMTTYKNQILKVYFTKEMKVIASPDTFPFINGVVLEYNYGQTFGKVVKVEMNQPVIINFL